MEGSCGVVRAYSSELGFGSDFQNRCTIPYKKAERLQWALTHENWTVATWAQGSWSSAAVLQMRYHRDAFKWKEININMWGYAFWNQLGPLVLDRELDCPAPDL